MNYDEDIWPQVRLLSWMYRPRQVRPDLIEIHATRSGIPGRTPLQEYTSTKNWNLSRQNFVEEDNDDWGSTCSVVVGGGQICRVQDWAQVSPHYSLGHADARGLSLEIGQNLDGTPFEERDLELAAQQVAEWCVAYDIPPRILAYLSGDNREAPGLVRHDRSANGTAYGKSDPGRAFNEVDFLTRVRRHMGQQTPAPPAAEEDDTMFVGHYAEKLPHDVSWKVYVGKEGARKREVKGAAEHDSLVAAGWPVKVKNASNLKKIITET